MSIVELVPAIGFALLILFVFGMLGISVWGIRVQSRATALARSFATKDLPSQKELIQGSIDKQGQSIEMQRQSLELQRETVALLKKVVDVLEDRTSA